MKRLIIILILLCLCAIPAKAMEFDAPDTPSAAEEYIPKKSQSFVQDLWYVIKIAISKIQPELIDALRNCISLLAVSILIGILDNIWSVKTKTINLVSTISISVLLISPAESLFHLGVSTVQQIVEYGKLLFPVLAAALSAQGGTTSSTALYCGTLIFMNILSSGVLAIAIPILYVYLCLCIADKGFGDGFLKGCCDFIKWLLTWSMKIIIFLFTAYLSLTGVISGAVDASAVKAAKMAMNGAVPILGGAMADASETVLVSAQLMKNTVGVNGLLVIFSLWISPFLTIGIHYLLLKITGAACSAFGSKQSVGILGDFACAMGFVLAMVGTVLLLLLVGVICFMKGAS